MKTFLFHIIFLLATMRGWSQTTNSFEEHYKKSNPSIRYRYDSLSQTHDYSNNWDLDGDRVNDQVYFIGTGGVHAYYFLRLILSSDSLVRDYPFIDSDFPVLPHAGEPGTPGYDPADRFVPFAVHDFTGHGRPEIFIRLNEQSFVASKKELNKLGITSRYILIKFQQGKLRFENYVGKKE